MLQLGLYDKVESYSLGASYALRRVKILQDLGKDSVFRGNSSLVEVSFSERVTKLTAYTFNNNFNLRSITFPKELVHFEWYAFSSCRNLKTVDFEGDVKSLPQSLFSGCWGVKEYWFKNVTQVPVLGNYVFNEMPSYCKIYVPSEMVKAFKENDQWKAYAN
jgi:hypothetical protein